VAHRVATSRETTSRTTLGALAAGDAVMGAALGVDAMAAGRQAAATCDLLLHEAARAAV